MMYHSLDEIIPILSVLIFFLVSSDWIASAWGQGVIAVLLGLLMYALLTSWSSIKEGHISFWVLLIHFSLACIAGGVSGWQFYQVQALFLTLVSGVVVLGAAGLLLALICFGRSDS